MANRVWLCGRGRNHHHHQGLGKHQGCAPGSQVPVAAEPGRSNDFCQLAIDGEGQIFWNGEAIHRDALDKHFAAASARQPELHLRADRKVAYEKVADVMAAAQRASIVKIAFLTQPTP